MNQQNIDSKSYVSQLLRLAFYESKAKRQNLSLRQFSKRLGIQAPIVSQVISEKRPVTAKLASQILHALQIAPADIQSIMQNYSRSPKTVKNSREVLTHDSLQLVADWWHFAILAMAESKERNLTQEKILERLNITSLQVKNSLQVLEKLGLVEIKNKKIQSTGKPYTTTVDIPSEVIKRYHAQGFDLAHESLYAHSVKERDFSSMLFCFDAALMAEAKKTLARFRKSFEKKYENKNADEVYKLQLQFFPITKLMKKDR